MAKAVRAKTGGAETAAAGRPLLSAILTSYLCLPRRGLSTVLAILARPAPVGNSPLWGMWQRGLTMRIQHHDFQAVTLSLHTPYRTRHIRAIIRNPMFRRVPYRAITISVDDDTQRDGTRWRAERYLSTTRRAFSEALSGALPTSTSHGARPSGSISQPKFRKPRQVPASAHHWRGRFSFVFRRRNDDRPTATALPKLHRQDRA